jgi:hypothetical protein
MMIWWWGRTCITFIVSVIAAKRYPGMAPARIAVFCDELCFLAVQDFRSLYVSREFDVIVGKFAELCGGVSIKWQYP